MEEYYTDLINIYIMAYNRQHGTNTNLFNKIENYEDTNDIMEEFYEHLNMFKTSDENMKKIYSPQEFPFETIEELYGLKIEDNIVCICQLLIPLLNYVVENIDWKKEDWIIVTAKYE